MEKALIPLGFCQRAWCQMHYFTLKRQAKILAKSTNEKLSEQA
ncbi:hypothetical protein ACO0K9_09590 [Undibacterium sp. Ji50W]